MSNPIASKNIVVVFRLTDYQQLNCTKAGAYSTEAHRSGERIFELLLLPSKRNRFRYSSGIPALRKPSP